MRIISIALLTALAIEPDEGCLAAFDSAPPEATARRAAHELWIRDCADCHGIVGGADGRRSAELDPLPPDFSDPCRPLTDAWIARVILEGGTSWGGNAAMGSYHELGEHAEVLQALVELVQGFRGTSPCHVRPRGPVLERGDED
jgi:mono/diheme cytochrome c family protein